MSAKKFRFVSPGIFLDEIDKSHLDRVPAAVGPVVIGRAERGPGLRPVKVSSFLEFTEIFGNPVPGGNTDDVWRNGNRTTPMYAGYAARAWLKNGSPLTVVRVVGASEDDPSAEGVAGWETTNSPSPATGSNGGAFGLYIAPNQPSGAAEITGTLAAIFYLDEGSIRLSGLSQSGSAGPQTVAGGACELVESSGEDFQFKAIIANGLGVDTNTVPFNLSVSSDMYIRKQFNTNPTLLGEKNPSKVEYFLGESFGRNAYDTLPTSAATNATGAVGFIVALKGCGSREQDAAPGSTGWVISQDIGLSQSFLPANMTNLFKFTALDTGGWINSNVKISIRDIAAPTNPEYDPYGTFTVEVRDANDTDANPRVLESFTGCSLDPEAANYLAVKVGDKFAEWNKSEKRFIEYGDYNNKSKYIYVTPSDKMTSGELDPSLIPFGFRGPDTYVTVSGTLGTDPNGLWITEIPHSSSSGTGIEGASGAANPFMMTGPQLPLRSSSSFGGFADPTNAYWGVTTDQRGASRYDPSYADLTRMLPDLTEVDPATQESFVFSLDNIAYVSSSTKVSNQAYYQEGLRVDGKSLSAGGLLPGPSTDPVNASASFESTLEAGFNRFTMPMVGGFDGFNVKNRDPLSNTLMVNKDENDSYAFNSIKRAIDTVADPELIEMNAAAIPGITNSSLTNHLVTVCQERADSLAIIDLEDGYVPAYENADGLSDIGSVDKTVATLKDRAMNSSYACAYYPWVQTKDEFGSGKIFWVPPSVAALGTFASNDKKSAPWFAPAGFTRGGLSDGAAGIPVIGVREHLTRKMRDKLYENNVNPIAKFPAEGIVIFGQKTMQATPSALDRVNVRRMMIHVKKGISNIASTLLFDQNVQTTWARFLGKAEPFLRDVKAQLGLTAYKIVLDDTTTTPDLIDRNIMYAKIFLQPARSIEFIAIDFIIQRTGASFDD